MKLSILKNATPGCTTYYIGNDVNHTKHLKDCVLICKPGFDPKNNRVKVVYDEDPQLYFYKLSHKIENEYTFINSPKVGKNVSIDDLAKCSDTISNEIFTKITRRVYKTYVP